MSLIGGGSDDSGGPTRKTHIKRIYKDDDPDSGIWIDIERIDELTYSSGVGFAQQTKVWTFDWADFDPDGDGVTKKKIKDPNDSSSSGNGGSDGSNDGSADSSASVVLVPVRDKITVTQGTNNQYQEYTHFFVNDNTNTSRSTHSRRVYHYDVPDDQLDENKNPPRDPQDYLNALGDKDASQYLEVEILDSFTTSENENRDSHGQIKPSAWQEKEWLVDNTGALLHDRDGDTSNDRITNNPADGVIDPPWRLDPLQNIVNVQLAGLVSFAGDINAGLFASKNGKKWTPFGNRLLNNRDGSPAQPEILCGGWFRKDFKASGDSVWVMAGATPVSGFEVVGTLVGVEDVELSTVNTPSAAGAIIYSGNGGLDGGNLATVTPDPRSFRVTSVPNHFGEFRSQVLSSAFIFMSFDPSTRSLYALLAFFSGLNPAFLPNVYNQYVSIDGVNWSYNGTGADDLLTALSAMPGDLSPSGRVGEDILVAFSPDELVVLDRTTKDTAHLKIYQPSSVLAYGIDQDEKLVTVQVTPPLTTLTDIFGDSTFTPGFISRNGEVVYTGPAQLDCVVSNGENFFLAGGTAPGLGPGFINIVGADGTEGILTTGGPPVFLWSSDTGNTWHLVGGPELGYFGITAIAAGAATGKKTGDF